MLEPNQKAIELSGQYGEVSRTEDLLLLCLLNGRYGDAIDLIGSYGITVRIPKPTSQPAIQFNAQFVSKEKSPDNIEAGDWEFLVDNLDESQTQYVNQIFANLSEGDDVLPNQQWFGCGRLGITRLTPCQTMACPSWVDGSRSHCDLQYSEDHISFDSISSGIGKSSGSTEQDFDNSLQHLRSFQSGVPQKLLGLKPMPNYCSGCPLCGIGTNSDICRNCIDERTLAGAQLEQEFGIPTLELLLAAIELNASFVRQAESLGISLNDLSQLYAKFKLRPYRLLADDIFDRPWGRRISFDDFKLILSTFWINYVKAKPTRSLVDEFTTLHSDLKSLMVGLKPLVT